MYGVSIHSPKEEMPPAQKYFKVVDDFDKIRLSFRRQSPCREVCLGIEPEDHLPPVAHHTRSRQEVEAIFCEHKIDYPENNYQDRTIWVDKDSMKIWVIYFDKWRLDDSLDNVKSSPLEARRRGNEVGDIIVVKDKFWVWKKSGYRHYYRKSKIMIYDYNYGKYTLESKKKIRSTYKKEVYDWVGPE